MKKKQIPIKPFDAVDKPEHYHKNGLDPLTVMGQTFTREEYVGFAKGNVLKYVMRYKEKNGLEDLKKARFYLEELIEWESVGDGSASIDSR